MGGLDVPGILRQVAISAVPILVAITFHEVAHGLAAYKMGDGTAKFSGRLTLNPLAHIDPIGTVLLPVILLITTQGQFVFGYAKPVPINPYNFRNPKRDMALSAAAGPGMNLALAVACVLLVKLVVNPLSGVLPEAIILPLFLMLRSGVLINVVLAAFNLIPVPPLDGGRVLAGFLPIRQADQLNRLEPYGMIIVIILIMTGLAGVFITPLIRLFMALLNLL
ncbi:MAG: site-2 protease family protein [Nitrospirota bacterium]|jgi:Zn-dependent protease